MLNRKTKTIAAGLYRSPITGSPEQPGQPSRKVAEIVGTLPGVGKVAEGAGEAPPAPFVEAPRERVADLRTGRRRSGLEREILGPGRQQHSGVGPNVAK